MNVKKRMPVNEEGSFRRLSFIASFKGEHVPVHLARTDDLIVSINGKTGRAFITSPEALLLILEKSNLANEIELAVSETDLAKLVPKH